MARRPSLVIGIHLAPVAMEPRETRRKQMEMSNIRELSADELAVVSGGDVKIPPHSLDKLLATIDKALATLKEIKPGGYLPPG
jgi:hypothetical protein